MSVRPETWTHWTAQPGVRWQAREAVRARVFVLLLLARAGRDPVARAQLADQAREPMVLRIARARVRGLMEGADP